MDQKKEKRQNGPKCLTLEETVCETTAIFGRHPVPLHVTSRLCYSMMRARAGVLNRICSLQSTEYLYEDSHNIEAA